MTYEDPETGYTVFTRIGLLQRERCCGAGCRHCPFDHAGVKLAARARTIQQAAWLSEERPDVGRETVLLFWSGGKDSFLAYRALSRETDAAVVLLTTFDARSRMIAQQGFPIDIVVEQASRLGLPLIGVPLHPGVDYLDHVAPALGLLPNCAHACFGDLHLDDLRDWRAQAFAADPRTAHIALSFPLWKVPHAALLADLEASGARAVVSAVSPQISQISVGETFDSALIARLPDTVDPFGENGEFHTRMVLNEQ